MDTRPPKTMTWALIAVRAHMIVSLVILGAAVWAEGPEVTSTWNYYHVLLGMNRLVFPAFCFIAALMLVISSFVFRRNVFALAIAMFLSGLPYIMYVASATYYVYFVLTGRAFVTFAIYWTAMGSYYVSLILSLAAGLWVEYMRLNGRSHRA